jgi:hypothetical protein
MCASFFVDVGLVVVFRLVELENEFFTDRMRLQLNMYLYIARMADEVGRHARQVVGEIVVEIRHHS